MICNSFSSCMFCLNAKLSLSWNFDLVFVSILYFTDEFVKKVYILETNLATPLVLYPCLRINFFLIVWAQTCKELSPDRETIEVSLTVNWKPFWELIKDPREGKPDLTDDRSEPETNRIMHWIQNSITKEDGQNHQPSYNHHPIQKLDRDVSFCEVKIPMSALHCHDLISGIHHWPAYTKCIHTRSIQNSLVLVILDTDLIFIPDVSVFQQWQEGTE